jgi:hypothetical protein
MRFTQRFALKFESRIATDDDGILGVWVGDNRLGFCLGQDQNQVL